MMKQKTINKLFYFFLTVLILPNIIQIYTEGFGLWGNMVNIIAPIAFYILALTVGRRIGRTVIILFPILFLGAFQLVLTYLYGRGPIAVDMWLNLVTTNGDEVGELLSQLLPAIGWVVIIYVPTIILAITLWTKKRDFRPYIRETLEKEWIHHSCGGYSTDHNGDNLHRLYTYQQHFPTECLLQLHLSIRSREGIGRIP